MNVFGLRDNLVRDYESYIALEAEGFTLDGNRFRKGDTTYLPLYEAKMIHQFDHRFGTYHSQSAGQANQAKLPELDDAQHADIVQMPLSRYWVASDEVDKRLSNRWNRGWLMGWRDITNTTNERTVIAAIVPRAAGGDTLLLMLPAHDDPRKLPLLIANLNSFVLDYAARQKVGGTHLKYHVFKQLPVLPAATYDEACPWACATPLRDWLLARVLELIYTAHDLQPLAVDCGYNGPPFRWDRGRRFQLRCELDAAFFHLYGVGRDDVDYIMDTFPIVRRHDQERYGEYRTKRLIREQYDAMRDAKG